MPPLQGFAAHSKVEQTRESIKYHQSKQSCSLIAVSITHKKALNGIIKGFSIIKTAYTASFGLSSTSDRKPGTCSINWLKAFLPPSDVMEAINSFRIGKTIPA